MSTLGLLAIGQSPRADYTEVISSIVGSGVAIVERGALDDLVPADYAGLAPAPDEHPVISRLADGTTLRMSKAGLTRLINSALIWLAGQRVDVAVVMCTSQFHGVTAPAGLHVIEGQSVIDNGVRASLPAGKHLGVLVPLEPQERNTRLKFEAMGYTVTCAHANPYGPLGAAAEAAKMFAGCDAVIMHCMGYTRAHRRAVREACGCCVLESNALVGHIAAELLSA